MRINIPNNRKKRIIIGNAIIPSNIKTINPHKVSSSPHLEQSFKLKRGLQSGCMMKQMHKRMMTATIPLTTIAAPTPAKIYICVDPEVEFPVAENSKSS